MSRGSNDFSYSKIDTYDNCPFKFKLKYIDDIKVFSPTVATELGTAIHACEEAIARAIQIGGEIPYITLKNQLLLKLVELQQKYPVDFSLCDKSNRTITEKVYDYLDNGIYNLEAFMREHPSYKIVGIEQPFTVQYINNYTFNGFIDRVFFDSATNKYLIQDIKTYAIEVENKKLTTPLQFVIYALAVMSLFDCTEDQIFCQYYLPFCHLTQDAGTDNFIKRGKQKIDKIFSNITEYNFKPNPSPLCHFCEYCKTNEQAPEKSKFLCPYFCHWTNTNKDFSVEFDWQGLDKHNIIMENYIKQQTGGDLVG